MGFFEHGELIHHAGLTGGAFGGVGVFGFGAEEVEGCGGLVGGDDIGYSCGGEGCGRGGC